MSPLSTSALAYVLRGHRLQEGDRGVLVLGARVDRPVVGRVAHHVRRVADAAGHGREGGPAEVLLGELRRLAQLGRVLPRAHEVHGGLALVEERGRATVAVVDGVEVLAEGTLVDELLDGLGRLQHRRVAPAGGVAVLDLLEDLGSADPVEQVLHPHQLGPLVGAAESEGRDALGLEGGDGVLQVLPGLGGLELVLGEERTCCRRASRAACRASARRRSSRRDRPPS